jgi:hypothetical protein
MPGSGYVNCSAAYLAALTSSHQIATAGEVWAGTALLATLQIEAATSVTMDRNSIVRRTCSAVMTDPYAGTPQAIIPTTAASLLTPYGNELVLYRGITYPSGAQELIQLGVFGIDDVDIDDQANDLVITITGGDRGVACQHAGFKDIYTIAPGTNVATAIQALISSLTTGLTINYAFAPTTAVTPTTPIVYQPGDDPWSMACQLAASVGYELFFDPTGVCTFLPVPNPLAQAISWSFDEGVGNIAVHLKRTVSRTNAPNYIIRDGSGSGITVPVRGIAFDANPQSPTYIGGSYGEQINYASSTLYADQPTAQAAANSDLLLALGSIEAIEVECVPKPDMDVDDVIEVTRARSGLASELYVVDSYTLGFGTDGLLDFTARAIGSFPPP